VTRRRHLDILRPKTAIVPVELTVKVALERSSGTVWFEDKDVDAGGGLSGVVITDTETPDGV